MDAAGLEAVFEQVVSELSDYIHLPACLNMEPADVRAVAATRQGDERARAYARALAVYASRLYIPTQVGRVHDSMENARRRISDALDGKA